MKLYMYAIVKTQNEEEHDEFCKVMATTEIKEYPGAYENIGDKFFINPWDNILPKDCIGKVFNKNDYVGTNIVYSVYLLEDDKIKAMSLIKDAAQKDLNNICKQLEKQHNIIGTICGPVNDIKDI